MNLKHKMLVVDDIEMNRAMLVNIFKDDYWVLTAGDGKEAMTIMGEEHINIVLLDLSMPVMDGYEVIEAMKSDVDLCAIPIVITTGAIDSSERKAFDLGVDDFITKPYDPYIVKKRVDNLVQKYVLQIENLKQSLNHAEDLAKTKSTFFSRMSHELRTPLNSVISVAELMKFHAKDVEKVLELNEKIEVSSKYLLTVINDILDMSAIENQKMSITKSPFDFRNLIEEIAQMFYGQCKDKNIDFQLNLTNFTEEYLFGDSVRLKQVIVNLVSNAIKFTETGGKIIVKIRQLSRVANMVKLRFQVIDNGIGIDEENQKIIFDAFHQGGNIPPSEFGGSGLGLSIVKNIVELMGGTISLKSKKGEGSTFSADIPFNVAREMRHATPERLKNVRALVVDDDKETQNYATMVMKRMGIKCDVANSGKEALELMQKAFDKSQGYDICFIDWKMPEMSGIEMTKKIRSIFDDDTVIVVASAYDVREIEADAKMAGANITVSKPMFQSAVFDLLMDITGGKYERDIQQTELYNFKGKRILLAEDNMLNAEVATEILQNVGFKVQHVNDGKEAVETFEKAAKNRYDAIIMDIQMPIMDGYEATKRIRNSKKEQGKNIPIIAVTANAFTTDVKASLVAGMDAHVAKPINTEKLYSVLDKLIGQN